ncbi:hypothetical protein RI367_006134 [Sorochytrium milnesiophthora]
MSSDRYAESVSKAIAELDEQTEQWQAFKADYAALKDVLAELPTKTHHDTMVPLGNLAYMPGRLVHTNEVMVLLGDNWFVEKSASEALEVVDRRLEYVESNIRTLTEQREDFRLRRSMAGTLLSDSSGGGGGGDPGDLQAVNEQGEAVNEEGLPFVDIREELSEHDEQGGGMPVSGSVHAQGPSAKPVSAEDRAFLDAIFANATDDDDDAEADAEAEEDVPPQEQEESRRDIKGKGKAQLHAEAADSDDDDDEAPHKRLGRSPPPRSPPPRTPADIYHRMLETQRQQFSPPTMSPRSDQSSKRRPTSLVASPSSDRVESPPSILKSPSSDSLLRRRRHSSSEKSVHFSQELRIDDEVVIREDMQEEIPIARELAEVVGQIAERSGDTSATDPAVTLAGIADRMHMVEISRGYHARKQQLRATQLAEQSAASPSSRAFNAPLVTHLGGKTWQDIAREEVIYGLGEESATASDPATTSDQPTASDQPAASKRPASKFKAMRAASAGQPVIPPPLSRAPVSSSSSSSSLSSMSSMSPTIQEPRSVQEHPIDSDASLDSSRERVRYSWLDNEPTKYDPNLPLWRHPLLWRNKRTVAAAVFLLAVGMVFIGVAAGNVFSDLGKTAAFGVTGALTFIPGAYTTGYIYLALRGHPQYRFEHIPSFDT